VELISWILPVFAVTLLLFLTWLPRCKGGSWTRRVESVHRLREGRLDPLIENPPARPPESCGLSPAEAYARWGRRG
jgi:hypothetical protein